MTALTRRQAKAYYGRFAKQQDWQRFCEDKALHALIPNEDFSNAAAVSQFGCGTGRLAEILLDQHLPPRARPGSV